MSVIQGTQPAIFTSQSMTKKATWGLRRVLMDSYEVGAKKVKDFIHKLEITRDPLKNEFGQSLAGGFGAVHGCNVGVVKIQKNHMKNKINRENTLLKKKWPNTPDFIAEKHFGKLSLTVMKNAGKDLSGIPPVGIHKASAIGKMALEFLVKFHEEGYGHFDLKPSNLTENYVLDLGLAKTVGKGLKKLSGTLPYLAPEVFVSAHNFAPEYTEKADMWSLGCTLFETFTGERLIHSDSHDDYVGEMFQRFNRLPDSFRLFRPDLVDSTGKPKSSPIFKDDSLDKTLQEAFVKNQIPKEKAEQFVDLLHKLLQFDPKKRISAADAIKHPFFTEVVKVHIKVVSPIQGKLVIHSADPIRKITEVNIHRIDKNLSLNLPKSEKGYLFTFSNGKQKFIRHFSSSKNLFSVLLNFPSEKTSSNVKKEALLKLPANPFSAHKLKQKRKEIEQNIRKIPPKKERYKFINVRGKKTLNPSKKSAFRKVNRKSKGTEALLKLPANPFSAHKLKQKRKEIEENMREVNRKRKGNMLQKNAKVRRTLDDFLRDFPMPKE